MNKPYVRLDRDNAVVLLVDHQAGLLSLVRDMDPDRMKNNVLALADAAKFFNLPTILTTSFETGPNGPLMPELKEMFPDAPYIARPGQINAWDNEDFVKAIKATGKKQLIIAGVVTEVCVAFPALSAIEEGFEVFVVADASGTFNEMTRNAAWDRMSSAGAQIMTWFGMACELHRDWRRDIEGLGALCANHIPDYRNLMNFAMPSGEIGKLSQPGSPLYGIEHSNEGLITFPGGLPIVDAEGMLIGAVGVSGDTVENDNIVAKAGAEVVGDCDVAKHPWRT